MPSERMHPQPVPPAGVDVPMGWRLVPDRLFPIMGGPAIPWCVIEPCERQAQENHGQSLKRLAERGGLDCGEAVAVLTGKLWRDIPKGVTADDLLRIVEARLKVAPALLAAPAPAARELIDEVLKELEDKRQMHIWPSGGEHMPAQMKEANKCEALIKRLRETFDAHE